MQIHSFSFLIDLFTTLPISIRKKQTQFDNHSNIIKKLFSPIFLFNFFAVDLASCTPISALWKLSIWICKLYGVVNDTLHILRSQKNAVGFDVWRLNSCSVRAFSVLNTRSQIPHLMLFCSFSKILFKLCKNLMEFLLYLQKMKKLV